MSKLPVLATVTLAALTAAAWHPPRVDFAAAETARIRAHLDSVERELRAKDVSRLTPAQRAARLHNLDVLHAYWVRGAFPRNTDFPGARVPYFIDRFGTRCAMAYLIEQSGDGDFVARVAATTNNARIPELRADAHLGSWLWRNGITLDEAARIQPEYCPSVPSECYCVVAGPICPTPTSTVSAGYKVTSGLTIGADVVTVALNVAHIPLTRQLTGALGIAGGLIGIAVGSPNFNESGSRRTLGFVDAGSGALSAALGLYHITHKPLVPARLSLGPWVDGRGGRGLTARYRL